ncbi:MAG TPA: alpha/beta hydrolase [Acidimicrobiales bacterium]|nr:alpha/beta hydrolase [Acidimicrobiales bacterium]
MRRRLLLLALPAAAVIAAAAPSLAAGATAPSLAATAAAPATAVGSGQGYVELSAVSYGPDPAEVLDAYLPDQAAAGPRHAVIVIHGGGWESGGRADMASEAQALARAGLVAVNVDYPLDADAGRGFPQELTDVEAAVAWIRTHATLLHVDGSRIGALGASAGGNLAMELGAADQVAAVVSWSGPTNLAAYEEAPYSPCTQPACGALSLSYAVYHYLGCMPWVCPTLYAAASPAGHLGGTHGAYMVWNSSDELVPLSQADGFVAAARRDGLNVQEHVIPGHLHADQYESQALAGSVRFLAARLG